MSAQRRMVSGMTSWSPLDPTPVGPLARGGGGAHRAALGWECWEPALPGGCPAQGQNRGHSSSEHWDFSRRGDPSPQAFPGNHLGILRTSGASPHTSAGWRGESSPGRGTGTTRNRLSRGRGHVGGACQQWASPGYQDPSQASGSSFGLLD